MVEKTQNNNDSVLKMDKNVTNSELQTNQQSTSSSRRNSNAIDQFYADHGMVPGPDERASLISSLTNGPQVEMLQPGDKMASAKDRANMRDN